MYSCDTNIFIDLWDRRYPPDIFPSLLHNVEQLILSKKLFAVDRVREELQQHGSPNLKAWTKAHRGLFVAHDVSIQTEAHAIQIAYPGLIDVNELYDEADRYIIALAKKHGYVVVTHETPASAKRRPARTHYIPDVCAAYGIPCIDLVGLMRQENWIF